MAKKKRKAKGSPPEAPTCHCLLMCDDIVESRVRSKQTLVGVIGVVWVPSFPIHIGGYVVYARLSNVYGDQKIHLEIGRDDGTGPKLQSRATVNTGNPLEIATIMTPVPPLLVERSGRYVLSLEYDGLPLATMPFDVYGPPPPEEQNAGA